MLNSTSLICNAMKKPFLNLLFLLLFISSFSFAGKGPKNPKAKTLLISGKVTDVTSNELLAGVKISCNNCDKVFYSDLDGRFFIYLEVPDKQNLKLEFSQIGYSSKSLSLQELQAGDSNLFVDLKSE